VVLRSLLTCLSYSPAILIVGLVLPTLAGEVQVSNHIQPESPIVADIQPESPVVAEFSTDSSSQLTSVSQLSDIQPTDWAFQALRSLVERYSCIAGYPNSTYRGNRAITRYEFAAGLNACLDRVNELIATGTSSLVAKEDLATIQKLQQEFATELAVIRSRVDTLEVKTAELEAHQFSPTAKLSGEAIFAIAGAFGGKAADRDNNPNNNPKLQDNVILGDRIRLSLDSSFTGKDFLKVRLQARNLTDFLGNVTGTAMTRLSFAGSENNQELIDELYYYFPVNNKLSVTVAPVKIEVDRMVKTLSLFKFTGSGSLSMFGRFNPIYRITGGAAIGANYEFNKHTSVNIAYTAANANVPTSQNGLFDGSYNILAQLFFEPIKNVGVGLTYVNTYYPGNSVDLDKGVGSTLARRPFGNVATSANSFGLETSWRINPKLVLAGWAGYSIAHSEVSGSDADILNYAVTLAFPDLGGKGNLGGFVFGMPPKVISSRVAEDKDTSFHIEGFYRFQLTDNIAVTPGVFVITSPEHNSNNDTIVVGTVRTTFTF